VVITGRAWQMKRLITVLHVGSKKEMNLMIIKKCKYCGSTDVKLDAWAEWDVDSQKWILGSVFDNTFCPECDGETAIIEEEV
jgi:hypothetical protein